MFGHFFYTIFTFPSFRIFIFTTMILKRYPLIILLLFSVILNAQEDLVAREYFINGEFEKALTSYKKLYNKNTNNTNYLLQLVKIEQQLELYKDAETRLLKVINTNNYPELLVELGYNYNLQNDSISANKYYNKAIATLDDNTNNAYRVGRTFENLSLLNQAITTYKKAMTLNPSLEFNMQLARIYGTQGEVEKMFESYIDLVETSDSYLNTIKRSISEFITDDASNENNIYLKKILLKKYSKHKI